MSHSLQELRRAGIKIKRFPVANEREYLANLFVANRQQKVGPPAITLGPQNIKVWFRVDERLRPTCLLIEAITRWLVKQGRRQLHRPLRCVTLVNLQFFVDSMVGPEADIGDDFIDLYR